MRLAQNLIDIKHFERFVKKKFFFSIDVGPDKVHYFEFNAEEFIREHFWVGFFS